MSIYNLLSALIEYQESKKDRDDCYQNTEYDAGYFCFRYDEAMNRAEEEFEEKLTSLIKEAVSKE